MQIVTGYKGQAHITSNDDQGRNQGTFGTGGYVLSVGSKFAATIISANEIHIADGEGVFQGVHFRTRPSNYDSVTIENGVQGMLRKDLIVCRYRKEITGIESMDFIVIKGEAAASNPVRPSYTEGQILEDALVADMPMYEVSISGITVQGITPLFSVLKSMKELQDLETSLNSRINHVATTGPIDIKGYNSSTNYYVFPEDGYVTVNSGSGATAGTYIRYATKTSDGANAALNYMNVTGSYQAQSIFVKKGMYGFLQGTNATNQYEITYVPLNR